MKKDLLNKYHAPMSLIEEVADEWEIDDIKTSKHLIWLYYNFPLTAGQKDYVFSKLNIQDSDSYYQCCDIKNCSNIFYSSNCENSTNVRDSSWITDSSDVRQSKNVDKSKNITLGLSIYNSENITDSEELENCYECVYCEDSTDLSFCYRCISTKDAVLCTKCIDCYSIICCCGLKHSSNRIFCNEKCNTEIEYAICNKKVSESTFRRTKERLEKILLSLKLHSPNDINGYFYSLNDANIWQKIIEILPFDDVKEFCYSISLCSKIF